MLWVDYPFDVESLPNVFTCVFRHADSGMEWIFEVSDRVNQSVQFITFVKMLGQYPQCRMVGFMSIGYDYPLIHYLIANFPNGFYASDAYKKSQEIINTPWHDRFRHNVRPSDWFVRQVDLYKIWHFDNKARQTSLKQIEIALRMACVVEFDEPFDQPLAAHRIPCLIAYNRHDVNATWMFLRETRKQLEFRDKLTERLGEDMTNQSDSNIGSKIFIKELNDHTPGMCGRSGQWRQTPRSQIRLSECVLPDVQFRHWCFQTIHKYFLDQTITETTGAFKKPCIVRSEEMPPAPKKKDQNVVASCYGLHFYFGTGGIHAAKDNRTWRATPGRVIQARDVKSYYPNLAIRNRIFPEHLSEVFCDIYERIYDERSATPKTDPTNEALKLALNGTYGNSNSKYSPFYDPKYTMTITINGQLLLCMLAESLAHVPTLELIQVNTDGVMYAVDADRMRECDAICRQWEDFTNLTLETEDFDLFAQRDVNNYLARDVKGKLKPKGVFEYQHGLEMPKYKTVGDGGLWWKNQSNKIIPIAAEKYMTTGKLVAETVNECDNPFYFMSTLKVQKTDRVMLGGELIEYEDTLSPANDKGKHPKRKRHLGGTSQQRVGRFYMTQRGEQLWKIMAPLKKLPHHERPQMIEKGQSVMMCNDLYDFDWNNLDRSYYIQKAQELVNDTGFHNDAA